MKKYLILGLLFLAGCDGAIDSQYTPQIVVEGFIFADGGIDSVILHYTTPYTEVYNDSASAINDAIVYVTVDGSEYPLLKLPSRYGGRYYLPKSTLMIQGGKTYALTVQAGAMTATASTTVPMPISITNRTSAFPAGNILLLDTNNATTFTFNLLAGPVDKPDRLYMIEVAALDTAYGKINTGEQGPPVDTLAYARYGFIQTAPNFQIYSRLFGWFGPNLISTLAIDTNWVDYKRAVGYGGEAMLAYQPSLNHINGGIGCWGSAGRDTISVFVKLK